MMVPYIIDPFTWYHLTDFNVTEKDREKEDAKDHNYWGGGFPTKPWFILLQVGARHPGASVTVGISQFKFSAFGA